MLAQRAPERFEDKRCHEGQPERRPVASKLAQRSAASLVGDVVKAGLVAARDDLHHINIWIGELPTTIAALKRFGLKRTYAALNAIGRALSYLNTKDETHISNIKQLRKVIQEKYGKEYGLELINKGQLSDSDRTRLRNADNKQAGRAPRRSLHDFAA